ncbi:TfoX/Sxy family protein [Demequina capsici]|uniref:TfoX/Sxy family protein n=1 Tax=Demequina capsici TaxID=3075620 RepID=A0AA96F9A4_9MICO|nr:TfoX/Sxy family protein [Demequina sp. OYTSA14]WNM25884.1 TfoX/Sxy family protein [Demequina sp. OYTSA14]
MQLPQHSDEAKAYFRSLVDGLAGIEVRPMFGSVGAFVNGNMFAGLFGDAVGVKLDPTALDDLRALPGSGPFGPAGRPMGGYASLPPDLEDGAKVAWLERALAYVATLPPKAPKAPKPRRSVR